MLIITHPYPDEFCRGHIGRLGRLNNFNSIDDTIVAITRITNEGQPKEFELSELASIAQQCDISTKEYARQHSFLAYLSFTYRQDESPNKAMGKRWTWAVPVPRSPHLCEHCVEEDMINHGISFWRRTHQFPGMHWCTTHNSLLRTNPSEHDFFQMPHHQLQFASSSITSLGDRYSDLPETLTQFHRAVDLISKWDLQLNRYTVKRALWQHLCSLGQQGKYSGQMNKTCFLSDLIISTFPIDWLIQIFPNIQKKRKKQTFAIIDSALLEATWTRPSSAAIAFFLALFFDDPMDGLNYLQSVS